MLTELSLSTLFEEQVQRTPDAIALLFEDHFLSYRELNKRANQLAHALIPLGIGPEVPVGILLDRSLEMIIAVVGVLKAGGCYVPLDSDFPSERLSFIVEQAQLSMILTQKKLREKLVEREISVLCLDVDWEKIAQAACENLPESGLNERLAYIIFTSGSMGRPKGVAVTHRNLINYCRYIQDRLALQTLPCDQGYHFATGSSISTDLGNTAVFPALLSGGCLHILSYAMVTDSDSFVRTMTECPVDVLKIVPTHLSTLMSMQEGIDLLPRAFLLSGGEVLTKDLLKRIEALRGSCWIINHYGPTETTVGSLTYDVESMPADATTIPIGYPIANTESYVLDQHLQPVAPGSSGELYIAGEGVARGYYQHPVLTAERFLPNPFRTGATDHTRLYKTGDVVRQCADGSLEFLQRADQQVKIRGFRVEPGEIENCLRKHPAVCACVVLTRMQEPENTLLVAYLVLDAQTHLYVSDLQKFLRYTLPAYMMPSDFVILDRLPLTSNGKIDRQKLHNVRGERLEEQAFDAVPENEMERVISAIWQEVLGIERVGTHDNFFDLGGHSLLMAKVHSKLKRAIKRDIPVVDLFHHPTVSAIASHLNNQHTEQPAHERIAQMAQRQKAARERQKQRMRGRLI